MLIVLLVITSYSIHYTKLYDFIIFTISLAYAQDKMDFEAYDPPSTLVVPEHPVSKAKFPFIDIHSHHWRMAEQDLDKLIKEMDAMNMAILVNLSGRGGDELKAMLDNVNQHYPERIAIFTNLNFDRNNFV